MGKLFYGSQGGTVGDPPEIIPGRAHFEHGALLTLEPVRRNELVAGGDCPQTCLL